MINKSFIINLRMAVLLAAICFASSWSVIRVFGQGDRPRRVEPDSTKSNTPLPNQSQETKPSQSSPANQNQKTGSQVQPPTTQHPDKQGQNPPVKQPDPEPETLRINSRLITVPVSVTDANGVPVRNLKAEDFVVEEDGTMQQVQTLGEPGKTPIEMVLLFDVSRSIRNRFDFEREAAGRFLKEVIKVGDGVSIFSIGTKPILSVPRTDKSEKAIAGALGIQPTDESTAFYDTVVKAAQYISDSANPETRRVIVALSDGEDTNSVRFKLGDAVRELQRSESLFYSINPSGPSIFLNRISVRGQEGMFKLATETGGMAFLPDKIEDLPQVFGQITAELQAQYLLGYYSTNETADGKFRRITVKAVKHGEFRIRARPGYYAPKEQ